MKQASFGIKCCHTSTFQRKRKLLQDLKQLKIALLFSLVVIQRVMVSWSLCCFTIQRIFQGWLLVSFCGTSNPKAWMTRVLFHNFPVNYLSPFAKDYFAKNNLANKILLIVNNSPGHLVINEDLVDNIRVVFLPPNTRSLIKLIDQSIITTFKAYYMWHIMNSSYMRLMDRTNLLYINSGRLTILRRLWIISTSLGII